MTLMQRLLLAFATLLVSAAGTAVETGPLRVSGDRVAGEVSFMLRFGDSRDGKSGVAVRDGIVQSDVGVSDGIVESDVGVRDRIVESDVDVRDRIVESNVGVRDGIVEGDVGVRDGIVESDVSVSDRIVESDVSVRDGIVESDEDNGPPNYKASTIKNKVVSVRDGIMSSDEESYEDDNDNNSVSDNDSDEDSKEVVAEEKDKKVRKQVDEKLKMVRDGILQDDENSDGDDAIAIDTVSSEIVTKENNGNKIPVINRESNKFNKIKHNKDSGDVIRDGILTEDEKSAEYDSKTNEFDKKKTKNKERNRASDTDNRENRNRASDKESNNDNLRYNIGNVGDKFALRESMIDDWNPPDEIQALLQQLKAGLEVYEDETEGTVIARRQSPSDAEPGTPAVEGPDNSTVGPRGLTCDYQLPEQSHVDTMLSCMRNILTKVFVRVSEHARAASVPPPAAAGQQLHLHRFVVAPPPPHRDASFEAACDTMAQDFMNASSTVLHREAGLAGAEPCAHQQRLRRTWRRLLRAAKAALLRAALSFQQDPVADEDSEKSITHHMDASIRLELSRGAVWALLLATLCDQHAVCLHQLLPKPADFTADDDSDSSDDDSSAEDNTDGDVAVATLTTGGYTNKILGTTQFKSNAAASDVYNPPNAGGEQNSNIDV